SVRDSRSGACVPCPGGVVNAGSLPPHAVSMATVRQRKPVMKTLCMRSFLMTSFRRSLTGRSGPARWRSIDVRAFLQDARRDEDQELGLVVRPRGRREQLAEARDVAEEGHLRVRLTRLRLVDAAEHDGLAVVDEHLRDDVARVDAGNEAAGRARHLLA